MSQSRTLLRRPDGERVTVVVPKGVRDDEVWTYARRCLLDHGKDPEQCSVTVVRSDG